MTSMKSCYSVPRPQVLSHKLLDAEFSDPALRAYFIPFVSERFVRHGFLSLYRRSLPEKSAQENRLDGHHEAVVS